MCGGEGGVSVIRVLCYFTAGARLFYRRASLASAFILASRSLISLNCAAFTAFLLSSLYLPTIMRRRLAIIVKSSGFGINPGHVPLGSCYSVRCAWGWGRGQDNRVKLHDSVYFPGVSAGDVPGRSHSC